MGWNRLLWRWGMQSRQRRRLRQLQAGLQISMRYETPKQSCKFDVCAQVCVAMERATKLKMKIATTVFRIATVVRNFFQAISVSLCNRL